MWTFCQKSFFFSYEVIQACYQKINTPDTIRKQAFVLVEQRHWTWVHARLPPRSTGWNLGFTLVQVYALTFVKNEIGENEAKDDLGVWPWYTANQGQRWKVSYRDSLSLSYKAQLFDFAFYGPEVKACAHFRTATHWPRIPVLTPKPSFLLIFEPTSHDCEQTSAFMINNDSDMTLIDFSLSLTDSHALDSLNLYSAKKNI